MTNYKAKLETEKKLLEEELAGIGKKNSEGNWEAVTSDAGATEADESDMDDRGEEYEERTSLINVLEKRLHAITKALIKIEEGTYGVCDTCGGKIEEDRLEANTAASTCTNCM